MLSGLRRDAARRRGARVPAQEPQGERYAGVVCLSRSGIECPYNRTDWACSADLTLPPWLAQVPAGDVCSQGAGGQGGQGAAAVGAAGGQGG